jgi:putative peptidoglycan lipid II flippase
VSHGSGIRRAFDRLTGPAGGGGRLGRTTLAFVGLYALARVVAFGRESVIAYTFGTTRQTDAYVAATTIPEFVGGIILSGVIGYAIIPHYLSRRGGGDEAGADRFLQAAMWHVLVVTGALTVAVVALAGPLTSIVSPGLDGDGRSDAVLLLRLTSPAMVFFGLSGFAAAVLNARESFLPVPLSFLVGNVAGIAVLVALTPAGIVAAAFGYLGAALVYASVQWWAAHRAASLPLLRPVWRGAEVAILLRAGLPAIVIVSALYLRGLVERLLASTASAGDLAALGFATRLLLVVAALLAVSVGTVSFPAMTQHAIAEKRDQLVATVRRALGLVVAMSLPFTLLFVLAPSLIVRVLFEHGEFTAVGTHVTASILQTYAVGLVAICVNEILVRALFAVGAQRGALVAVLASLGLNVGLDIWLLDATGIEGVGTGASISLWVNAGLLALVLKRAMARRERVP